MVHLLWIDEPTHYYQASLVAQLVKNQPAMQETPVGFLGWEEGIGYPLQYSWASLVAQTVKNPPAIPGLGRSPEGQHGNPLEYSCLGNCHGQWSWTSCSPWSCKELDMTEQLSTAQHTLSPIVYGFSLDLIHSMSFGKCIMTCTYHYSVKQSHFTALKILCTLPICLSLKWSRTPQSLATVSSASFSSVEKL